MADYELLKAKTEDTALVSIRPPLGTDLFRLVAAAVGFPNTQVNTFVMAQVGVTTEFSWPRDENGLLSAEQLDAKAKEAIRALASKGLAAELMSTDVVQLEGPADAFKQYEAR